MPCRRILFAAVVIVALTARARTVQAQAMDKSAKPAMQDSSAMQHGAMPAHGMSSGSMAKGHDMQDSMAKGTMSHDGMAQPAAAGDKAAMKGKSGGTMAKGKAKPAGGTGTMADSAKMSHP